MTNKERLARLDDLAAKKVIDEYWYLLCQLTKEDLVSLSEGVSPEKIDFKKYNSPKVSLIRVMRYSHLAEHGLNKKNKAYQDEILENLSRRLSESRKYQQ